MSNGKFLSYTKNINNSISRINICMNTQITMFLENKTYRSAFRKITSFINSV